MFTKSSVSQALIDATKAIMEEDNKKMLLEPELDETGFHKAAHAAKKASQSHFEFQGKKYPVTAKSQSEGMIPPEKIGGQISKKKDDKAAATGKLADVREADEKDSPFNWRGKPSQLPKKPGELTGHDSKKLSTGTLYTKKFKKDKEEVKEETHSDEKEDKALVKKMVKTSALKNEEKDDDSKYTTKTQVKKIADKEVHKHEKSMHHGKKETDLDEERHMTGAEKEKRETIVKSMKKGLAGFKDRYGNRAKNVMYATATKQAMKHEDLGGISTMSEGDTDVRVDPEENMKSKTVDTLKGRTKVGADYHNKPLSYKLKLNVEDTVEEGKGTDVNPVFSTDETTPLSMAKDLAKKSFGKIRKETIGMAGHTSEEKKHGK